MNGSRSLRIMGFGTEEYRLITRGSTYFFCLLLLNVREALTTVTMQNMWLYREHLYTSIGRIIETRNHIHKRRFPTTSPPDNADGFSF